MLRLLAFLSLTALMACAQPVFPPVLGPAPVPAPLPAPGSSEAEMRAEADRAVERFVRVVRTVEPVAEQECRARVTLRCDFQIVVDDAPDQPANAFQFRDRSGRPVIAFNLGLIGDVQNADELAFVMAHEAAHHILEHLDRQKVTSDAGARVMAEIAVASGATQDGVLLATRLGAALGARSYSKEYELEADALGAQIAQAAGYDALRGALYFTRIPDPGDRFLGSHPPNAERLSTVRRAIGRM